MRDGVSQNETIRPAVVLLCLGTVGAGVAHAQGACDQDEDGASINYSWEVTPVHRVSRRREFRPRGQHGLADVDLDDHGSFGLAVNLFLNGDKTESYELLLFASANERGEELAARAVRPERREYLHLGGTLNLNDELPVRPYIVGGLGLTRFSPQTGNGGDDSRFSILARRRAGAAGDEELQRAARGRGFLTLVNSDSAFLCTSDTSGGACAIRVKGESFIQYELLAGAAFAF